MGGEGWRGGGGWLVVWLMGAGVGEFFFWGGGVARLSDFFVQIIQFCAAVSVSTLRNDVKRSV